MIQVRDLTVRYPDGVALQGVSLRVRPGTFTAMDIRRNELTVQLPAKSVVVLEIK